MPCKAADPAWRQCGVATTLDVVGGRWKAPILFLLLDGTERFSAIQRRLPGVTQRMLAHQLRELERDGVITRRVYAQIPPKVEYSLTAFGRGLEPVLLAMSRWGRANETTLKESRDEFGEGNGGTMS